MQLQCSVSMANRNSNFDVIQPDIFDASLAKKHVLGTQSGASQSAPVTFPLRETSKQERVLVSQSVKSQDELVNVDRTAGTSAEELKHDSTRRCTETVTEPGSEAKSPATKERAHKPCTAGLRKQNQKNRQSELTLIVPEPSGSIMASRSASFLVASLGNPPPYHSTRHSAAHIVLRALQSSMNLPSFAQKSKSYGGGHVCLGTDVGRPEFTLYQSAVQMNVSGPPLLKAWKHFAGQQDIAGRTPALVVLHDEMEIQPGSIKVRRGNGSAKGHNGIKSVQNSFSGGGLLDALGDRFVKIAIGIGRPAGGSRQSNDVSAYVLGQLTSREKDGLDAVAGQVEGVLYQELARIQQS